MGIPPAILNIRVFGDESLKKKSALVKEVGPAERMLIDAMIRTMYEDQGIGLAAPQVGVLERILVADIGDGPIAVVNPQVIKKSGAWELEEGCLSVPGVEILIKRPKKILLKYVNAHNETMEQWFEGLLARVILHEIDHLNGKLIVDHASLADKRKWKVQLEEIKKIALKK